MAHPMDPMEKKLAAAVAALAPLGETRAFHRSMHAHLPAYVLEVAFDREGQYTVTCDDTDCYGGDHRPNADGAKAVATLLAALPLNEVERARLELAYGVLAGNRTHPLKRMELKERTEDRRSEAERLVLRYARMYSVAQGDPLAEWDELAAVEPADLADGTRVLFARVGRNASHWFYLGWDGQGNLWGSAFSPEERLEGEPEDAWHPEEFWLAQNAHRLAEAPDVHRDTDVGYVGHY